MANGKTFKVNASFISNFGSKMGKAYSQLDIELQKRVTAATNIIWRTAHARRPMMTKTQMKKEGRKKRVSDPGATLGVPVQTGRLQASIRQSVTRTGKGFQGKVETNGISYAGFIEYGTSRMDARPFMRPAADLNKDVIKRVYDAKVEHQL